MPPHNLPLAVFPHPDIREAKFFTERLAIFVFACLMVISIANHQVLAVHVRFKGHTPLDRATNPINSNASAEIADLLRKHGGKTGAELKAEGK